MQPYKYLTQKYNSFLYEYKDNDQLPRRSGRQKNTKSSFLFINRLDKHKMLN